MRFLILLLLVLPFKSFSVTSINNSLCSGLACMSLVSHEGYTEVIFKRRVREPQVCYARWENFKHVFSLGVDVKRLYLRDGYHFSGISWRCDYENTCQAWMKGAGVCE